MKIHRLLLVCLLLLTPAVEAAKIKPATEITQLPENEEERDLWDVATGHEQNLEEEGRIVRDAALEAYLESIADRLLEDRLDHLPINIRVFVVSNNLLSAWVYPYGKIAVNTCLLAGMENEAQLAAILAHELSHFIQRHSYRELIADKRQSVVGKGLGLLATAAAASQTGTVDTSLMNTGGLWTDLVTSGYSRKNEHIADAQGLEFMIDAGYDAEQAVRAFEILRQNDEYGVVSPALLWSSHPTLDDRLKNLSRAVAKEKKRKDYVPGTVPDPASYDVAVATALMTTGVLDLEERYFERARRALTRYTAARPDDARGHFLLAETDRFEHPDGPDFAPRISAYEAALEADPGYAPALREIGMAERQQGNSAEARAAFENYLIVNGNALDAGIIRWYLSQM